jgi:hypothetical protein
MVFAINIGFNMKKLLHSAIVGLLAVYGACAYADNTAGHHCDRPKFTNFEPPMNKYTQSFGEFSFEASANTVPASIVVTVTVGGKQRQWTAKDLDIDELRSGRWEITGKIYPPVGSGFARVDVQAHSKPGCEHHDGFLVRVH